MPENGPENLMPDDEDNDSSDTELEPQLQQPDETTEKILEKGRALSRPFNEELKELNVELKGLLRMHEVLLAGKNIRASEIEEVEENMEKNLKEQEKIRKKREEIEEDTKEKIRDHAKKIR